MVTLHLSTIIEAPINRCFDLARSIEVHLLGTERTGERAIGGVTSGLIGANEFVRWKATHFGVTQHMTSKITAYDRPAYFQDTMIEGAFRLMQHDHYFKSLSRTTTEMKDHFVFEAPLSILGRLVEQLVLKRYMEICFGIAMRCLRMLRSPPNGWNCCRNSLAPGASGEAMAISII